MHKQGKEPDDLVLKRAQAGDRAAFRQLMRHYDAGLRALAFRLLGDQGSMDEVLRKAYMKAYRGLATARGDAGVRTWIYRIAYDACMDELRRTGRDTRSPGAEPAQVPAPGPGGRIVAQAGLAGALALLPPDQRVAVMLVDADGFDYKAAGRVLGVAEGSVASRVSMARAALRGPMSDVGRGF